MTADDQQLPTDVQVADYERLKPLLDAAYEEFAEVAKKPALAATPASETKLRLTNQLLELLRPILILAVDESHLPFLDSDPVSATTHSDGVFILSQYRASCKAFHLNFHYHVKEEPGPNARWVTVENPGGRRRPL